MKKFALILLFIITQFVVNAQDFTFKWTGATGVFTTATDNLVAYIDFGDVSLWGYVEISLTYSYANQLTTGMYAKRYNIGKNAGYAFNANTSEVYAALGPVADQWKLGDFEVNGSNHLVIPIYHLVSSGNSIVVTISGVSLAIVDTSIIQLTTPATLVNSETRDYQHTLGPIAIGTKKIDPDAKLTVAGKISSREIKVDVTTGADFVFDPKYNLQNLEKLKAYVNENKHLPNIPAAQEMTQNGLNLGDFQVKLLQKIEELTLYLFEKDEQIKKLERRLAILEAKTKH